MLFHLGQVNKVVESPIRLNIRNATTTISKSIKASTERGDLTGDDFFCVKLIFELDETKSVHELDLIDFAAMGSKVTLHVLFGSYVDPGQQVQRWIIQRRKKKAS